jgi:TonB family protein
MDGPLEVLDRLETAQPPLDPIAIAKYRVFCLVALERADEARTNIDRMLRDRPLYTLPADEASPRIQSIFRDVRRQTLPQIVIASYAAAKAAFERKDPRAVQQFDDVLTLLDDPDVQQAPALTDLRTVASAFRDLAKVMVAPAGPAAATGAPRQSAPPRVDGADVIYTAADTDVTPPVPLSQRTPPWRPSLPQETLQDYRGALRLLIDESGAVTSASMTAGTRPAYDQILLRAARDWKFLPAQRQGRPVRYLKMIEIHLKATGSD